MTKHKVNRNVNTGKTEKELKIQIWKSKYFTSDLRKRNRLGTRMHPILKLSHIIPYKTVTEETRKANITMKKIVVEICYCDIVFTLLNQ